jgi:deoxyhypusine synthase
MYVHTDVTAVFPFVTHALFSLPNMKRKPQRRMDKLNEARTFLDRDVNKRRKELMGTLDWSVKAPNTLARGSGRGQG